MLRASHLGPTLFVTALATLLAWGVGQTIQGIMLVAASVVTGQLSIGWSNDWLDAGRDAAAGRTDKPIATDSVSVTAVRASAFAALAATVPVSLLMGWAAGFAQLGLVGSGWVYNLGVKATPWSWVPYAVGFGLLPAFVTLSLPGTPWPPWWAMLTGALLGVGAHFANVLPDIDHDLTQDVRGLPQRLGVLRSGIVAIVTLVAATLVVLVFPATAPTPVDWIGLVAVALIAVAAAWCLMSANHLKWVFRLVMLVALVNVVMVVAAAGDFVT